ncbi:MAG TPA: ATP-binding protein [Gemmatimonadales bacterium]
MSRSDDPFTRHAAHRGSRRPADSPWPPVGGGELAALCRTLDWGSTPLGPVESWPEALRVLVRTCLESPFPVNLWCGAEFTVIYNDAYRVILGDKHPAALGQRGSEVWTEIWDQIEPMFGSIRAGGPAVYEEDAPFVVERSGTREEVWFTFSLSPVRDGAGEVIAFLNVVAETTDRTLAERATVEAQLAAERAEAQLRDVFVQAPAFMAVLRGPDHVFDFANDAYYQIVGRRDIIGKPAATALPEVVGQGFIELLDQVLATGEPFVGSETAVTLSRTPGGPPEECFLDFVYQPLIDSSTGERVGIVAHGSEVTEQVLARREVERLLRVSEEAREAAVSARRDAEHANRAKSEFLTTMSHELRTPLNAIAGYADLLLLGVRGDLAPPQRDDVERIRRSGQHLLGLINDVLNFAKLEAATVEFRMEAVPIRTVVQGLDDLVRPQMVAKSLHYQCTSCSPELRVLGDVEKVRQVLLNLLTNAVKFTDRGGGISVSCDADDHWVRVHVADTGRGIDAEQLERIFDPFVQVDRHLTPSSQQGVGLGLAISRDLAHAMGGTLTARSEVGRGSTFTLALPRKK